MGMIGFFTALPEEDIGRLAAGTVQLEDLDPLGKEKLDIDKSWEIIHYILCGDLADGEPPLGDVIPLGQDHYIEFGDFGAFYLTPEQVRDAYHAIEAVTREELLTKFDYKHLLEEQIYPLMGGDEEEGEAEQVFDYVHSYFNDIRSFYSQVSRDGKGIVFYIL